MTKTNAFFAIIYVILISGMTFLILKTNEKLQDKQLLINECILTRDTEICCEARNKTNIFQAPACDDIEFINYQKRNHLYPYNRS